MIKEIKYNGFTETPSDYECPDGDLATVTGLVPEDEALHPVLPPDPIFTLPTDYTICYVHVNTGYKHYIVRHDYDTEDATPVHKSDFYWLTMPDGYTLYTAADFIDNPAVTGYNLIISFSNKTIYQINSIGNTLLFLTEDGMYYLLWKGDKYKNLGTHIPEAHLTFSLKGQAAMDEDIFLAIQDYHVVKDEIRTEDVYGLAEFVTDLKNEEFAERINESILAKVNAFIAERSVEEGKFIYPFLVRYAYRLYDESLVMHSAPVLMVTDSYVAPHCFITEMWYVDPGTGVSSGGDVRCKLGAMLYDLEYRAYAVGATFAQDLEDWKDIVKSVDIFVSAPLYTYNQAGKIKTRSKKDYTDRGFGIYNVPDATKVYSNVTDTSAYSDYKTVPMIIDDYGHDVEINGDIVTIGKEEFDLPRFSDGEMATKIRDCHNFYLLKSIPIDNVNTWRTKIDLPDNYLESLVNREVMTDDYESHDQLVPKTSFTYNSRLTIGDISKMLRNPFHVDTMVPYTWHSQISAWDSVNERVNYSIDNPSNASYYFYIFLREDNKEMVIEEKITPPEYLSTMGSHNPFYYFFYPNPNAYKVVIVKRNVGSVVDDVRELPLTPHDFLHGAVYHEGWNVSLSSSSIPTVTTDNTVDMSNKLYTSEVNNPFVFTSEGMKTIGLSSIIGIRPIVETVSPSQYGQFKFYVFTQEGVWALEVSSEGYLQSPQLVTPDIVLGSGESITQIDGSVLFAAERGIMMLVGSKSTCISDLLNSRDPFVPFATLPANDVLPGLRSVCGDFVTTVDPVPFRTFIQECRMLYDYPHQRIIVFNPSQPYAYVFSLKSKQWGMMPSSIVSTVPDYPAAMAMVTTIITPGGLSPYTTLSMMDFAQDPIEDALHPWPTNSNFLTAYQGLIITRPLKLDMPDVLKTVDSIIQRGNFRKGHVQSVLYGSRDLQNWFLVKSSIDHYLRGFRGTPYKYFRLALLCQLGDDESIFGCSIQFTPRYQNQLR